MPKQISLRERFYKKTRKIENGCLVWTASKFHDGYGCFHVEKDGKDVTQYAHRVAWGLEKGKLPSGKKFVLDHLCKNKGCVNVEHLELVPFRINILRGIGPTAVNSRKTHCPLRHPLSSENVYRNKSGGRQCKICAKRRAMENHKRKIKN